MASFCQTTGRYEAMIDLPWNNNLPRTLLEATQAATEFYSSTGVHKSFVGDDHVRKEAVDAASACHTSIILPASRDAVTDGAVASLLSKASLGEVSLRTAVEGISAAVRTDKSIDLNVPRAATAANALHQKPQKAAVEPENSSGDHDAGNEAGNMADASQGTLPSTIASDNNPVPLDDKYMVFELGQISVYVDVPGTEQSAGSSAMSMSFEDRAEKQQKLQEVVALPLPWMSLDGQQCLEPLWRRFRRAALGVVLRRPGLSLARLCAPSEYLPVMPPRAALFIFVALSEDGVVHLHSTSGGIEECRARPGGPSSSCGDSGSHIETCSRADDLFSDDFITSKPLASVAHKRRRYRNGSSQMPLTFEQPTTVAMPSAQLDEILRDLALGQEAQPVAVAGTSTTRSRPTLCVFPSADAICRLAAVESSASTSL